MKKLFKIVGYTFATLIVGFIVLAIVGGQSRKSPSAPGRGESTEAPSASPASIAAASTSPAPLPDVPTAPKPIAWNMNNPDAATNGNIALAARSITTGINPLAGAQGEAAAVVKAPWRFYGQPLCFEGTAGVVQDNPPGSNVSKVLGRSESSEIVIEVEDGTVVDLLSVRSSGALKVGDTVTVCGLAAGRVEVANQLGGKTTQLMLVGNTK